MLYIRKYIIGIFIMLILILLYCINVNKAYSKEDYNLIFKGIFKRNISIKKVNGLLIEKNIRALKRDPDWHLAELSPDGTKLIMLPEIETNKFDDMIPVFITLYDSKVVFIEPPDGFGSALSTMPKWNKIDSTIFYYSFARGLSFQSWEMTTDGKGKMISRKDEDAKLEDITSDNLWLILSIDGSDTRKTEYTIMQSRDDENIRIQYDIVKQGGDIAGIQYRMEATADSSYGASIILQDIEDKTKVILYSSSRSWNYYKGSWFPFSNRAQWLPDGSGILFDVGNFDKQTTVGNFDLWQVSIDGQSKRLYKGVTLKATSANARHWLFDISGDWYEVSIIE